MSAQNDRGGLPRYAGREAQLAQRSEFAAATVTTDGIGLEVTLAKA